MCVCMSVGVCVFLIFGFYFLILPIFFSFQPSFIQAPWGGVKSSGFGRELGRWGLEEFTSIKQVTSCNNNFNWGLWQ